MSDTARLQEVTPTQLDGGEISQFCNLIGKAPRILSQAHAEVTERYDLGPRGAWILGLANRGINSPSKLTEILRIQRSLITLELAKLTEAGLILTERNRSDGRRLVVKLTAKGRRVCTELEQAIDSFVLNRVPGYSREELLLVLSVLRDFVGSPGFAPHR